MERNHDIIWALNSVISPCLSWFQLGYGPLAVKTILTVETILHLLLIKLLLTLKLNKIHKLCVRLKA